MNRQAREFSSFIRNSLPDADRRSTLEWAEAVGFELPGSLRSNTFRIDISPWLRLPLELTDNPEVRRLLCMASVQSSKSTVGEVVIVRKNATDPGNMLYNWEDQGKAEESWNDRIERTIRDAKQIRHRLPSAIQKARKMEIQFRDGFYFRMQGIRAPKSRQSKSVRYLINEEVKDWQPGALTDLRNRVTAAWNSFELNITPGSIKGDEIWELWQESSQHEFHVRCPRCATLHWPAIRVNEGQRGGLHICDPTNEQQVNACKPAQDEYDYTAIAKCLYLECPSCGHRIKDKPDERRTIADTGEYVSLNPSAEETDKGVRWNALIVPWIPWTGLIKQLHNAQRAARYGDISLLQDFIQKREADFWDSEIEHVPQEKTLVLTDGLTKTSEGLPDRQFRFMMVDKQRGSPRKGEPPHYWVLIRDWKPGKCQLVWEGKVQTDEELETLRMNHDINPVFVAVDSGDGMTTIDVYRMCAKYGFTAIKGEQKSGYPHDTKSGRVIRRFSADQTAFATGDHGEQIPVTLILYSKQGIRDALHYLRTAEDFEFETPEDVSEDYKRHMESERLVDWHIPKTGQRVKIWRQFAKRNDLFVCECYQALYADIAGIIGMVPLADRPEGIKEEHPARG